MATEVAKVFLHHGERPPLYFWRDRHGLEVDLWVDLGDRRIPIEVKAGETVASDAFRGLDAYLALSGDRGGILVHGGAESYSRDRHEVRAWFACSWPGPPTAIMSGRWRTPLKTLTPPCP